LIARFDGVTGFAEWTGMLRDREAGPRAASGSTRRDRMSPRICARFRSSWPLSCPALLVLAWMCFAMKPNGTRVVTASPVATVRAGRTPAFGDEPASRASEYCLRNRTAASLILDRESDRDTVSIAACGLGMLNWAILVEQRKLDHGIAVSWCHEALDNLLRHNPRKNRGWFSHFTDAEGKPKPGVEVSTIDTTLLVCGAQRAAEQLRDEGLVLRVATIKAAIDVEWMRRGDYIGHGLFWKGDDPEFIPYTWDDYSEGVVIYRFFRIPYKPRNVAYDLPLFVYYYPLCFFDDLEIREHLRRAVLFQRKAYSILGVTACDGPAGYQANRTDIVSPLGLYTIAPLIPEAIVDLKNLRVPPETPAYQPSTGWTSSDRIGIDDTCCVIIHHRYRRK
jgi:hypothetical protein